MIGHRKHSKTGRRCSSHQGRTGFHARRLLTYCAIYLATASTAPAQSDPWSNAAGKLGSVFSGPIVKGLSLVAIVLGGLELAFGEGGSKRLVGGLIFGLGMALGAASFLNWLFPY